MRPLARVSTELRVGAFAGLAIGDLGLVASALRSDHPGRAVVAFAVVNVAMALGWGWFGSGRLRREGPKATPPPAAAALEPSRATTRRVLLGLTPVVAVVAFAVAYAPESAAVIAGVPAGIAAGDLWVSGWLRRFEAERQDVLLREAPASFFLGGQRPVYTLPTNELTADT